MPGITVQLGADGSALDRGLNHAGSRKSPASKKKRRRRSVKFSRATSAWSATSPASSRTSARSAPRRRPRASRWAGCRISSRVRFSLAPAAVATELIRIGAEEAEAVEAISKSTHELSAELTKTSRTGGISELSAGIDKAQTKIKELGAATAKEGEALHSLAMFLNQGLGGSTESQRLTEYAQEMKGLTVDIAQAERLIVQLGEEDLEVLRRRVQGREEEADLLSSSTSWRGPSLKSRWGSAPARKTAGKTSSKSKNRLMGEIKAKAEATKAISDAMSRQGDNIAAPGLGEVRREQSAQGVVDELAKDDAAMAGRRAERGRESGRGRRRAALAELKQKRAKSRRAEREGRRRRAR